MAAGDTKIAIHDKATFETWWDNYNSGMTVPDKDLLKKDFDEGIARKLKERINDGSFFLIKNLVKKMTALSPIPSIEAQTKRIEELKRFLINAISTDNETDLLEFRTQYMTGAGAELLKTDWEPFVDVLTTGAADTSSSPANEKIEKIFTNFFESYGNRENRGWFQFVGFDAYGEVAMDTVEDDLAEGDRTSLDQYSAGGAATESKRELSNEDNQCLLMSMIFEPGSIVYTRPSQLKTTTIGANKGANHYNDRIILLSSNNPSELNNKFVSDEGLKTLFTSKHFQNNIKKELFYVNDVFITGSNVSRNKSVEFPLSISTVQLDNTEALSLAAIETDIANLQAKGAKFAAKMADKIAERDVFMREAARGVEDVENIFALDSVNVKYEGTNPSTARNDVSVTIKFKLESFRSLNTEIGQIITKIDNTTAKESVTYDSIKLRDLVVRGQDADGSTGYFKALKNSYAPASNRIRLKISANPDGKTNTGHPLIIDLTTIDHTISRNSEDGAVDFTINYRGYFHSVMTMPFTDILASKDVFTSRKNRHANINKILQEDKGCKPETLREILRIERDTFEQENSDSRFSEILTDIYKTSGVYKAKFNTTMSRDAALANIAKAGASGFVASNTFTFSGVSNTANTDITTAEAAAVDEDPSTSTTADKGSATWVFLGAILQSAIKNLYEPNSSDTRSDLGDFNLKLCLTELGIPNPQTGATMYLRVDAFPIDIKFFAEWWNEVVIKKDLKIYPAGSFVRDLIERMVNNLLFEVCLSNLLPDEVPPVMRCQYFTSRYNFRSNSGNICDLTLPDNATRVKSDGTSAFLKAKPPYFVEELSGERKWNATSKKFNTINSYNYLVIYQQSPPLLRQLNTSRTTTLKDSTYIPTIASGIHSKGFAQVKNVSFSKNTAPFLREARYNNNNFGGLALMNNVYDLSFNLSGDHGNTYFYPGMIINFILTDFSGIRTKVAQQTTVVKEDTEGTAYITPMNYRFTDNDPHNGRVDAAGTSPSDAYLLGFGGYYMIKSVEYDLSAADSVWTISIQAKFIGTDFDTPTIKLDVLTSIESDLPECVGYYTQAVQLNQDQINLDPERAGEASTFSNVAGAGVAAADQPVVPAAYTSNIASPTAQKVTSGGTPAVPAVGPSTDEMKAFVNGDTAPADIKSGAATTFNNYIKYKSGQQMVYAKITYDGNGIVTGVSNGTNTPPTGDDLVIVDYPQ